MPCARTERKLPALVFVVRRFVPSGFEFVSLKRIENILRALQRGRFGEERLGMQGFGFEQTCCR